MSIRTVRPLTSRTGVTAMPAVPLERQARRDQRLPQSSRPGLPGPLTPPGSAGWRYPRNVPDPMLLPDPVVLPVLAGRLGRLRPMILDLGRPVSRLVLAGRLVRPRPMILDLGRPVSRLVLAGRLVRL